MKRLIYLKIRQSLDHTISLIMSLMVSKQRKKKCKSIKMIFLNPFLYTWDRKKTIQSLVVCMSRPTVFHSRSPDYWHFEGLKAYTCTRNIYKQIHTSNRQRHIWQPEIKWEQIDLHSQTVQLCSSRAHSPQCYRLFNKWYRKQHN